MSSSIDDKSIPSLKLAIVTILSPLLIKTFLSVILTATSPSTKSLVVGMPEAVVDLLSFITVATSNLLN